MHIILVCAEDSRERDHWLRLALADGAEREGTEPDRVIFRRLGLELRFVIFERGAGVGDELLGLELKGVLNFQAVSDQSCRSMIYARLRP